MPIVMATQSNIGGAFCESSVIPFLVPRRRVWLTTAVGVPCTNAANMGEHKTWTKVNIAPGKILSGGKNPWKCIYSVSVQEMAKHRAKLGWPPLNDVAAVTKARHEIRWNLKGCRKFPKRSQPSEGRSSCGGDIAVYEFFSDCRYMP